VQDVGLSLTHNPTIERKINSNEKFGKETGQEAIIIFCHTTAGS
jgi:hypothetical protein